MATSPVRTLTRCLCFCLTSFLFRVTPDLATKETVFTRQMPLMLPKQQHNHWPRLFSADSHEAGMPHTVTCLRSQYLANLNQEQNLCEHHCHQQSKFVLFQSTVLVLSTSTVC